MSGCDGTLQKSISASSEAFFSLASSITEHGSSIGSADVRWTFVLDQSGDGTGVV